MTIREKAKKDQLEARLKKAKEERDKCDEVIRNIQSQIKTLLKLLLPYQPFRSAQTAWYIQ